MELGQIAAALGGEIRDGSVLAPGPGHSRRDRSLSVKPDPNAPDGFLVHSFAGDDAIACKDYVRKKCGTPAFAQNDNGSGKRRRRRTSEEIQAAMAAIIATDRPPTPKGVHTHTYDYVDADGLLVNQVLRYEQPKSFRQRRPDGNGGWIWRLSERRVPYRLPDLLKYPFGTIFVTEGEKDADGLAERDLCATTVASGKWTDECVQALAGRDVMVLEDNDDAGRAKALTAAKLLHGVANSVRIIKLPGLPEHGDVSDWFEQDSRRTTDQFIEFCFDQKLFSPNDNTAAAQADVIPQDRIAEQDDRVRGALAVTSETPTAPAEPGEKLKTIRSKQPAILPYNCHRNGANPAPKYLVKKLLSETGVGLISGQWGTYKSYIALKLGGAIGMARPFAGYTIKRPGATFYIACEGASELPVRLEALSSVEHGGSVLPIYYCDAGVRLLDQISIASIIATAKQVDADAQRDHKLPLVLIVIDTVISAAAFAKSGDENDSAIGAKLMAALGTISRATGTFVLGIDHFGKVAETGTRGTSAKEDAADVVLALLATKSVAGEVTNPRLCVRKRRGGPAGIEHPFTPKVVTIGEDEDGEPITSLTIEFDTTAAPAANSDGKWTRSLGTLRRILMALLADVGEDLSPFAGGPMVRAVRLDLVPAEFYKQYVSADGDRAKKMTASRQAFHRAVTAAKDRGLVAVREVDGTDFVWLATSEKP